MLFFHLPLKCFRRWSSDLVYQQQHAAGKDNFAMTIVAHLAPNTEELNITFGVATTGTTRLDVVETCLEDGTFPAP